MKTAKRLLYEILSMERNHFSRIYAEMNELWMKIRRIVSPEQRFTWILVLSVCYILALYIFWTFWFLLHRIFVMISSDIGLIKKICCVYCRGLMPPLPPTPFIVNLKATYFQAKWQESLHRQLSHSEKMMYFSLSFSHINVLCTK